MKINKRIFLIVIFLIFPLLLTGCAGCGKKTEPAEKTEPTPEPVYHQLSLEEKPFVALTPRSDGRELNLSISGARGYESVEYEIVYFSDDRQLGLVGELDMKGKSSVTKTGLTLGSCSRGTCTYDPNVNRGNLTLRFRGENPTKLRSAFKLEQILANGGEVTSIDEKVTVNFPRGGFYVILMDPIGLPNQEKPEAEILAGPYALFSPANLGSFTIEFSEEGKILGRNSQKEAWETITPGKPTTLTNFVLVAE